MKGVERTNTVIVNPNQQVGFISRHNLYIMDVNRRQNCYNCRGFGHIAKNCRSRRIVRRGRRLKYGGNENNRQCNNLNRGHESNSP